MNLNVIKRLLVVLIIIWLILFSILIKGCLITEDKNKANLIINQNSDENKNQYPKENKGNDIEKIQKNSIRDKKLGNLNKLRTALLLYLEDHLYLPDKLEQLVGDYLTDIPVETISNNNKVSEKLDLTGGWYYNPQLLEGGIIEIIEQSLKPNVDLNEGDMNFNPYQIIIDREQQQLHIVQNKEKIKSYPIAVGGIDNPTPTGEFRIKSKYILNGKQKEVYGQYWIGIDLWTKGGGYGIHGTNNSQLYITKQFSRGCIRMRKDDLKELYTFIPIRTRVIIK